MKKSQNKWATNEKKVKNFWKKSRKSQTSHEMWQTSGKKVIKCEKKSKSKEKKITNLWKKNDTKWQTSEKKKWWTSEKIDKLVKKSENKK